MSTGTDANVDSLWKMVSTGPSQPLSFPAVEMLTAD